MEAQVNRTWMIRSGFVVIVLAALTALYARGREPDEVANVHEFELAERRTLEVTAEAAGLIEPIRLVEVKSKASGEILELGVESGDVVRRGDLLGRVDPRDVRNALAQAEADLDVARARLSTAESARRRSTELREASVITEQEFEAATLEEANARAQYIKARTNLELAQERMGDVTIRAPINGVIIRKDVESGQIIQSASQNISGGTTVLVMADLTEMQVRTLVSETDLGKIEPGMSARVAVEAFPGRQFRGTVTKIEPQAVVEQNVTMFPVLVHLTNHDGALKPGMNAEVVVEVARRDDAVTIPNAAVVSMRDAVAAGALFGLNEDRMRTALRAGRGGGAQNAANTAADTEEATPQPAAGGSDAPRGTTGAPRSATDESRAAANGVTAGSGQATALSAECQALRDRLMAAGGFGSASEEDRTRLRECMQAAGIRGGPGQRGDGTGQRGDGTGQRAGGADVPATASTAASTPTETAAVELATPSTRASRTARGERGIGSADVRPAVVFVQTAAGIEPRTVVLGVNDWDYTEVIRGIEPGEQVVLISVARLQQQQQEMLNRIRERNSGMFPGASGPGAGRR
jgi:HlyD family secretion protein